MSENATDSLLLRRSVPADVNEICAIYGYYVLNGFGTFEEVPPGVEEMGHRRSEVLRQGLPFWVADLDSRIVGFAYAGPYSSRSAYRFTAQISVYVHSRHVNRGIGKQLVREVIAECTSAGFRQMLALVGDSNNVATIRLFTRLGFRYIGQQVGVGNKFGRWVDVALMQRALGDGTRTPPGGGTAPLVPIP